MPKLTCNITGHSYYATDEQIKSKAESLNLSISDFLRVYVSKKASGLLQRGYSIEDIQNIAAEKNAPVLTEDQKELIINTYAQTSARRVLSNFNSISSLAIDESDQVVANYIAFLKKDK